MKSLPVSIIILGVCLFFSGWIISNAIENSMPNIQFPSTIDTMQNDNGHYELIVNNGWLYLYDTTNGQVWKKPDVSESPWVTINHYSR